MTYAINRGSESTETSSPDCAPVVCADCGGLVCLCRPRFFAGQLLTDEDLQRLDHYITEKNKLHNRYLVGWGVVCGMEVVCNACDGMVTVKPGYALSPCGEDIVICADAAVNICSMIQKCKQKTPRDCQPAMPGGPDPCADTTEQWILSVHYDEKSTRGVVPLKNTGGAACCSQCACGGSSSCGCGGKSSSNGNGSSSSGNGSSSGCTCGSNTSSRQSAAVQAQCEPTVVCETYHFEVCKVKAALKPKRDFGAMIDRFLNCLTALQSLVSAAPAGDNQQDFQNWCCAIRDNLLDFFADHPGYNCTIPQRLAVMCQSGATVNSIKLEVAYVLAEYLKDCFCGVLLPPCPCPVGDASVPLATITVSKKDGVCRIVSICNLDVRKFATTLPNLAYWLSFLPTVRNFRTVLSRLCCRPLERKAITFGTQNANSDFATARQRASGMAASVRAEAASTGTGAPANGSTTGGAGGTTNVTGDFTQTHDFSNLIVQAFERGANRVDVQTLAFAALGLTDEKDQPFLSPLEMNYPLETLLANQIGVPFGTALVPDLLRSVLARDTGFSEAAPEEGLAPEAAPAAETGEAQPAASERTREAPQSGLAEELAALKRQVDALQEDLRSSQDQLDKLSKRKKK